MSPPARRTREFFSRGQHSTLTFRRNFGAEESWMTQFAILGHMQHPVQLILGHNRVDHICFEFHGVEFHKSQMVLFGDKTEIFTCYILSVIY